MHPLPYSGTIDPKPKLAWICTYNLICLNWKGIYANISRDNFRLIWLHFNLLRPCKEEGIHSVTPLHNKSLSLSLSLKHTSYSSAIFDRERERERWELLQLLNWSRVFLAREFCGRAWARGRWMTGTHHLLFLQYICFFYFCIIS